MLVEVSSAMGRPRRISPQTLGQCPKQLVITIFQSLLHLIAELSIRQVFLLAHFVAVFTLQVREPNVSSFDIILRHWRASSIITSALTDCYPVLQLTDGFVQISKWLGEPAL